MKITYLKLVNVAGLVAGSNKYELEIDFSKSKNRIITIIAGNAKGKSVLLSSLSPFAGVTSIDERSSLSYIVPKEDGYKEIHYQDGDTKYIIKHYYKATDRSHTIKSYFMMDGEELNETGNVKSFNALVEIHMGLTQDMMRLIRIGSNVNSILSLTPAARKEYIGKLIDETEVYLKIFKYINDQIRVVKSLMASNSMNLYNCHIPDVIIEEERLSKLRKDITGYEKSRDKIVSKLATIKSLMKSNDIDDLKRKKKEAEASLAEFERIESAVKDKKLSSVNMDQLITKRADMLSSKIDTQSKINSYRISIDNTLRSIERLELSVKKITSDNDMKSLLDNIRYLRESIKNTNKVIITFTPPSGLTSDMIYNMIGKLSSFNTIAQNIHTFGSKPVEIYLRLRFEKVNVDKWLKEQAKRSASNIKDSDLQFIYEEVFKDDFIISPNCESEYDECPYYRLYSVIDRIKNKAEEESYDTETLRYVQIISYNIDNMMNEIDRMNDSHLPDILRDHLKERSILERLGNKLTFFDLSNFQDYLTLLREHEIYKHDVDKLAQYEYQLSIYKKSGVDGQMEEIKQLRDNIAFYQNNISALSSQVSEIDSKLQDIDEQISLVSRYNDSKKYKKMFESTLEATDRILGPLENAEKEKMGLEFELTQTNNLINAAREQHKQLEGRIIEYNRLVDEGEKLQIKCNHLEIILKASSTRKGIPVKYMKRYLGKIKNFANNLLGLIYGEEFKLAKFNVSEDLFEIPYVKNGRKVSDVKYSSQSEFAMSSMALSFALANKASGSYNIPLLDEVDGGLDEDNRPAFMQMLFTHMQALQAEQAFVISQNLNQMVNVPMDCIILSDTGRPRSKLQNVIYE